MKPAKDPREVQLPRVLVNCLTAVSERLHWCADQLSRWARRYGPGTLKVLLALFCLPFFTASVWVVACSLTPGHRFTLRVTPIQAVPLVKERRALRSASDPVLVRVHRLVAYLDSLGRNPEGRRKRDSLLEGRPHLMDTLRVLDALYLSDQKNNHDGKTTNP